MNDIEPCCWYCRHRHRCSNRCPNDFTLCQFCAWFLDRPCLKFELDEEAYEEVKKALDRLCQI